jgi:hypothetical protein
MTMNTRLAPESEARSLQVEEPAGPLGRLWRQPSMTVARFLLMSHLRSGWLWGEMVYVLALFAVFWNPYPGDQPYFFTTGGAGLGALAVIGTAIMTRRALSARVYLPLARLSSRASIARGLVIASGALRLPLYLLLLALVLLFHRIDNPSAPALLIGTFGTLANCVALCALTVALSPPLATRLYRIFFLAWLVLALMPLPPLDLGPLPTLLAIVRVPALPLAACYTLGGPPGINLVALWAVPLVAAYIIALTLLAGFWLARRDLILH